MRIADGRLQTSIPHHPKVPSRTPSPTPSPSPEPSLFSRVLHGLTREVDRGEALLGRISTPSGARELGNVELLALQAGVYRYSEAVDLSAKLVDRATSGVKTVIQGQ